MSGKPRDPPGVLPPREQTREPGTRPQLPEGWNKPRDPDARPLDGDWRTGGSAHPPPALQATHPQITSRFSRLLSCPCCPLVV